MAKYKFAFVLITLFSLVSCSSKEPDPKPEPQPEPEPVGPYDNLSFHTKDQANYLIDSYANILEYSGRDIDEKSLPKAIEISWDAKQETSEYTFELSKTKDFVTSETKKYTTTTSKVELYNLELNSTYYFRVDGGTATKMTTENSIIRNMYVGNIPNFRDLGGYKINGVATKQSLLYRSYSFNYDSTKAINDEGRRIIKDDLKIKTDLDLWGWGSTAQLEGVNYVNLQMVDTPASGTNLMTTPENKEPLRLLFENYLSKETTYPAVVHCKKGKDRTGMVSFLILCLQGVSIENIYRDFLFSNFAQECETTIATCDKYFNTVRTKMGFNLATKAKNFLIEDIGVSEGAINSFLAITK